MWEYNILLKISALESILIGNKRLIILMILL